MRNFRANFGASVLPLYSSIHFNTDRLGRLQFLAMGPIISPLLLMTSQTPTLFAAENKKGFLPITNKKDKYSFLYPFGWQEVVEGEDKVYKDVIEPLGSVSVNVIPSSKENI